MKEPLPYDAFRNRNEKRIVRFWIIASVLWSLAAIAAQAFWDVDWFLFSMVLIFAMITAYVVWVLNKTDIEVKELKGLIYRYIIVLSVMVVALIGYSLYFTHSV